MLDFPSGPVLQYPQWWMCRISLAAPRGWWMCRISLAAPPFLLDQYHTDTLHRLRIPPRSAWPSRRCYFYPECTSSNTASRSCRCASMRASSCTPTSDTSCWSIPHLAVLEVVLLRLRQAPTFAVSQGELHIPLPHHGGKRQALDVDILPSIGYTANITIPQKLPGRYCKPGRAKKRDGSFLCPAWTRSFSPFGRRSAARPGRKPSSCEFVLDFPSGPVYTVFEKVLARIPPNALGQRRRLS